MVIIPVVIGTTAITGTTLIMATGVRAGTGGDQRTMVIEATVMPITMIDAVVIATRTTHGIISAAAMVEVAGVIATHRPMSAATTSTGTIHNEPGLPIHGTNKPIRLKGAVRVRDRQITPMHVVRVSRTIPVSKKANATVQVL